MRCVSRARWLSWSTRGTSSDSNKSPIIPSGDSTNMGDPQEQRFRGSALFTLKEIAKQCIVPQEYERLMCMVLIHLVKIYAVKVGWNLSCLINKYTNKTLDHMTTVLVTAGNIGEKPPQLIFTLIKVTATEIASN